MKKGATINITNIFNKQNTVHCIVFIYCAMHMPRKTRKRHGRPHCVCMICNQVLYQMNWMILQFFRHNTKSVESISTSSSNRFNMKVTLLLTACLTWYKSPFHPAPTPPHKHIHDIMLQNTWMKMSNIRTMRCYEREYKRKIQWDWWEKLGLMEFYHTFCLYEEITTSGKIISKYYINIANRVAFYGVGA